MGDGPLILMLILVFKCGTLMGHEDAWAVVAAWPYFQSFYCQSTSLHLPKKKKKKKKKVSEFPAVRVGAAA